MTRPISGLHQNMMVMTPPVMGTALMPRPLAFTVPSVCGKSAVTLDTAEILPSMSGTRLEHAWSAGASTDWAENGKIVNERHGILNINIAHVMQGPGVLVNRVPGERRSKDIINM